ncbi:MAG: helix-turn-helix transcriptional regulator [Planctomycetota bacterium]
MIKLGQTIKYVRETKGLTQRAAAEVLGISDVHLCNLEHDKARPSVDLLEIFSNKWNVDLYVLSWCLFGDVDQLPKAVRNPMKQLAKAWRSELAMKGILKGN